MAEIILIGFATLCYMIGYFHGARKHVIAKGQSINPRRWDND